MTNVIPTDTIDHVSGPAEVLGLVDPEPLITLETLKGEFVDVPKIWEGIDPFLTNGLASGLQLIYPLPVRDPSKYVNTLTDSAQRRIDGLLKFFYSLVPVKPERLSIYTYLGLADEEVLQWFRFQAESESFTFAVREFHFDRWMESVLDDKTIGWCLEPNQVEAMQKRGLHLNVSKAPIELPLHFFFVPFGPSPIDELYNGDFTALEGLFERLRSTIITKLRDATLKSAVLVNADIERDHDLYLVFKAVDNFKALNITLDKVDAKLPESGEVSLGQHPTTLFDWNGADKKVLVAVKSINAACNQINRAIENTRLLISQHPIIQQAFDEKLKVELFAATHFTKRVYGFGAEYGKQLVQDVANDVIRKLTTKAATGARIGLDLNSWVTWEYHEGTHPTRSEDPEVDFVNNLFNRYTESFIEALYAFLINIGNPLIRPYDYREVADMSDGIALGTIRRVK